MIRAERLGKRFDRPNWPLTAVDALDLEIAPGEVFGFLGPNGAGKTTTVRMLCGLIGPSEGRAWVNGFDVATAGAPLRTSIGVLTEQPGLYDRLSAYRNLHIYAQLYELSDPAASVEKIFAPARAVGAAR